MNRPLRIAIELFGPALIAVLLYSTVALIGSRDAIFVKGFFLFLIFAYVIGAIPSIAFTLVIEYAFSRGLRPNSLKAVGLSSALGLGAGIAIAFAIARGFHNNSGAFTVFPALGCISGALVGLCIFKLSTRNRPNKSVDPTTTAVTAPAGQEPRHQ